MFNKTDFVAVPLALSLSYLLFLSACVPLEAPPIDAGPTIEVMVQYDPEAGELPEGIAIDSGGNIYISLAPLGEVRQLAPDGTQTVVATIDPEEGFGMLGLAMDDMGIIYAAINSVNPAINGVHRISTSGESAHLSGTQLSGTAAMALPNGIAFDPAGTVYATDTVLGAIWRIPQNEGAQSGEAEIWLQDALLAGTEALGFGVPAGANGIAYHEGAFYVANMEKSQIVRIPLNDDGSAGAAEILITDEALLGADGIAFDRAGNLYVASVISSMLLKIDLTETVPTVSLLAGAADGLDGPASLAFGTSPETSQTIYLTNFALVSEEKRPSLMTFDVEE